MEFLKVAVLLVFLQIALSEVELHCVGKCRRADNNPRMEFVKRIKEEQFRKCEEEHICGKAYPSASNVPCVDGKAGEYECLNVDLLSFVPLGELGSNNGNGNDIWGWTDPETKREYAISGCTDGTSFVDVSEPTDPKVLAFLPTHTSSSSWRDMKVHLNHAFIISEASNHGMQVFDLTRLRDMTPTPGQPVPRVEADAHYDEMTSTHNIVSNEESGFMYAVGTRTCTSGLHMIDVRDPKNPKFAGCFGEDGYVHDAQCVKYKGPDARYDEREICFCYNENTLTIVDVEDKSSPKMLSRVPYENNYYTHQGWLNEQQTHLLLDDELDELYSGEKRTRTLVWDVQDLEKPVMKHEHLSDKEASDHNLYIKGNLAYQTNYCAGLRILDVSGMTTEPFELKEVAYFDVAPYCNAPGFEGSWSNYPYFESGTIIVQSIERGLFVLKHTGSKAAEHKKL